MRRNESRFNLYRQLLGEGGAMPSEYDENTKARADRLVLVPVITAVADSMLAAQAADVTR
jgi:hypothetical protein